MSNNRGHLLLTTCVMSGLLLAAMPERVSAQRTWVVDAFNGAGADFRDLPPAVLAASPGDTLRVRRGGYNGFTTGKPLKILAESVAGGGLTDNDQWLGGE